METVVVIGGGASGMMAALTAAESGRHIVLLERQQRVARKLLATGNGRCNLTNTGAGAANYHGENAEFALPALSRFTPQDMLDFFHALGLVTVTEYGGRVYPLSNSANSVVDVLRFALKRAGVELRCGVSARSLSRAADGAGYVVGTDDGDILADYVIVACGGAAGAKLGGVMDGYELLKPLGHKRTRLCPALVQLTTAPEYPRALKGVRADAALSLLAGGEVIAQSRGEVQFTETGLSGPAAFDVSRAVSTGGDGFTASLDFMRNHPAAEVMDMLARRCRDLPALPCGDIFTGMLHNRLGRMLARYARLDAAAPLSTLSPARLQAAADAVKGFSLRVTGTEGFDSAQVTAGGIRTSGFDPETLQSWFMPRLFICGELLDIDGDCGGYNLQWAWASGRLAGRLGE